MVEQGEFAFFVSEPNERARRTLRGRWGDRSQIKIERSVVVEVGNEQDRRARLDFSGIAYWIAPRRLGQCKRRRDHGTQSRRHRPADFNYGL